MYPGNTNQQDTSCLMKKTWKKKLILKKPQKAGRVRFKTQTNAGTDKVEQIKKR